MNGRWKIGARDRRVAVLAVIASLYAGAVCAAQDNVGEGKQTFHTACSGCHTIGGGRLVGPDLKGVGQRRTEAWVIAFVQHPQQVIASGDPIAKPLVAQFDGFVMPDQSLAPEQIRQVLAYIKSGEPAASTALTPAVPAPAPTEQQVQLGQALFDGTAKFANGGPACHSCHEVQGVTVIGGGTLARDLTTAFSRLGGPGLEAIIAAPPFPFMQRAYANQPLAEQEVAALVGFLRKSDEGQALHHPPGFGPKLAAAGGAGSVLLLLLYSLVWGGRLKGPVHQGVYDRQTKST